MESLLHAPLLSVILRRSEAVGMSGRPGAGPAIVLPFLLTAIACGLADLYYAGTGCPVSRCRQRLHIRLCHRALTLKLTHYLMVSLPVLRWLRFFVWLGVGLVIYWVYSRRHSEFATS